MADSERRGGEGADTDGLEGGLWGSVCAPESWAISLISHSTNTIRSLLLIRHASGQTQSSLLLWSLCLSVSLMLYDTASPGRQL